MPHPGFVGYQDETRATQMRLYLALEHIERLEIAVQKLASVAVPQPAGDHRRVDSAEIGSVQQVVAFIEFREARDLAVVPAPDLIADDEH